ncbi:MAG: metallophosphoesterase [Methylobacter sp.]
MADTFLIGDTHFGHKNIIKFEPRCRFFRSVEEHDAQLVANWNSVVRKQDVVWVLGDVLFNKESFETLKLLKGCKKLVMGNHDKYPSRDYLNHFTRIVGSAELNGYLLTHIPIHPSQFRRYKGNIHGHLHSNSIDDPRYICVSAERINLTPISFNALINKING